MTTIKKSNKRISKYGLEKNEYQGHLVWCYNASTGKSNNCFGANFFSIKSYDTTWVSRILNAPTLKYNCRWCGEQNRFDSIMFMNGELTSTFYEDFKAGKIDNCVNYVSKFLWTNGHMVKKESLKVVMEELFIHEEKRK